MKIGSVNNPVPVQQSQVSREVLQADTLEGMSSNQKPEPMPVVNQKETDEDSSEAVNEDLLNKALKQANKSLETKNRMIERSVHEVTHVVMYKIKDLDTNEVIAEFPPKKIEDMIAKMWELAGLFVDEKA